MSIDEQPIVEIETPNPITKPWLCRRGLHRWDKWKPIKLHLNSNPSARGQLRHCRRCSALQIEGIDQ